MEQRVQQSIRYAATSRRLKIPREFTLQLERIATTFPLGVVPRPVAPTGCDSVFMTYTEIHRVGVRVKGGDESVEAFSNFSFFVTMKIYSIRRDSSFFS